MQSYGRYVYLCLLVLCGGFAVLEYLEGQPKNATIWLFGLAITILVWKLIIQKKEKPAVPQLESILEPETAATIAAGEMPEFKPDGLRLRTGEICYWYDRAAQDYYNGKEGMMYLTNDRIVFYAPQFSFSHPLRSIILKQTRHGIELEVAGQKMKFITASTPLFLETWRQHHEQ